MNDNYLDQVLAAQKEWQAVSEDDPAIKKMAVESLRRCSDAVRVLRENLRSLGYDWAVIEKLPAEVIERNVTRIEKAIDATVPPILVQFWQIVGGVSFVDLEAYKHVEFWREQKLVSPKYFCDGLHVDNCSEAWAAYVCDEFVDWQEFRTSEEEKFLIDLSPDGFHKDNISGGSPYGVFAGSTWKPTWENFEWSGIQTSLTAPVSGPDFLSYIRTTVLECAGFPAFLGLPGFYALKERLLQKVPVF